MSDLPALLERYRRGAELLAMVLTGVFGEEEDFAIAPGKWSVRQIVAHLADAELVGAHRFRQVIAEDNPTIIAYDQDADFAIAPGKWSVRQIVAHLADAELVGAHRFRQVIAEDNPTIIAYDQDI